MERLNKKQLLSGPRSDSLVLPRWVLYAIYLIIIGQGIALIAADSFAIPRLGIADYLIPYGTAISGLALTSLVAAFQRWAWVECVSTFLLFAGLTSLVGFTFIDWMDDVTDRGALSIIAVLVLLLTFARAAVLFVQLVWRHAVKTGPL